MADNTKLPDFLKQIVAEVELRQRPDFKDRENSPLKILDMAIRNYISFNYIKLWPYFRYQLLQQEKVFQPSNDLMVEVLNGNRQVLP